MQPSRHISSLLPARAETAPVANPAESEWLDRLWLVSFGAHAALHVYAWADSLEDAFEAAVEHLDDRGDCGVFTILTEDDYAEAAEELGLTWDGSAPDDAVMEHAEAGLTPIGWTTLDCAGTGGDPAFVASWEWTGVEVRGDERARVRQRCIDALEEDK